MSQWIAFASWTAIVCMVIAMSWLKYSRRRKRYGVDPVTWHEWVAIAAFSVGMILAVTLGIMRGP